MKIFLSFLQSDHRYPIPAYDFWARYIKNGVDEAGHQWTECPGTDWARGLVYQTGKEYLNWKQDTWGRTIEWLKRNPTDLFLSYLYPHQVDVSAIKEIQKMGIPCINFFCDNVREFKKPPAEYKVFDLNWVPEYKALSIYKKAGFKYIHLPMPVWIAPDDRVIKPEKNQLITFLGSKDIQRQILFEEIVKFDPGLPLAIYGSGWQNSGSELNPDSRSYTFIDRFKYQLEFIKNYGINAYRNKLKNRNYPAEISPALLTKYQGGHQFGEYKVLTAESMITVGVNRYPSFHFPLFKPDTYSRLRDIEAPMLGACYLTEQTEGLEEMYEIGNEIEVYVSPEDFIEKAEYLQRDAQKRKTIKINGQKRALQDHAIPVSLAKMLSACGLKG